MRHIKSTGCGFSLTGARSITEYEDNKWYYGGTYNCQGTTELNPAFQHTTITVGGNFYDNYYNLPQKIKGFIMTLSPVIPMDTVANPNVLVVPETSCVNDFDLTDPASTDYYKLYGDPKLYVSINGSTYGGSEAMWNQEYTTDDAVYELNPGALEPMIDTAFPPVGVDNITFDDVQYTGGFILDRLNNSWRSMIQNQINTLYTRSSTGVMDWSGINGLFNILNTEEKQSECTNFQIKQHDPTINPVAEGNVQWTADRSYDVGEGTVYIDGEEVDVEGVTGQYLGISMEFYLDITPASGDTAASAEILTCMAGGLELDRELGHFYEFIGSVNRLYTPAKGSEPFKTNRSYTMFKITQGDCITDITLSGGTGGGTVTEKYEYNGPFKLAHNETSDEFNVIGTDTDFDGITPMAGRIFVCGAFDPATGWATRGTNIPIGEVYAHFRKVSKGWDVTYDNSSVLMQSASEVEEGEQPSEVESYTVRLGRIDVTNVESVSLPIYINGSTEYRNVDVDDLTGGPIDPNSPSRITAIEYFSGPYEEPHLVVVSLGDPSHNTTTVTIPYKYDIKQYHTGDVYIDLECVEPELPYDPYYNGPFKLTTTGVVCNVCPSPETSGADPIVGYYSINGGPYVPVTDVTGIDIGSVGGRKSVYLNVTASGGAVSTEPNTAANCYSVWLGDYDVSVTEPEEEGEDPIVTVVPKQMHYGNVQVDGRWS